MSTLSDYKMHARTCLLLTNNNELAKAVIEAYVNHEKEVAKANRKLNASLKDLFKPYKTRQAKQK